MKRLFAFDADARIKILAKAGALSEHRLMTPAEAEGVCVMVAQFRRMHP